MKKSVFVFLALILALVVVAPASAQYGASEDYCVKVEKMPTFQGGDLFMFRNWVMQRISYPQFAVNYGIKGVVLVSFIVERDGSIGEFCVIKTPHKVLSDEVIRVLKLSPKWEPGRQGDKLVRVKYTFPVNFGKMAEVTDIGDVIVVGTVSGNIVSFSDSEKKHGLVVSLATFNGDWNSAEAWAKSLGEGWRLPSVDELVHIYKIKNNLTLSMRMAKFFESTCWAAPDCDAVSAYVVDMFSGNIFCVEKKERKFVAYAVAEF